MYPGRVALRIAVLVEKPIPVVEILLNDESRPQRPGGLAGGGSVLRCAVLEVYGLPEDSGGLTARTKALGRRRRLRDRNGRVALGQRVSTPPLSVDDVAHA